ncbi:MAG: ATP-dependent zinc metalloprotease FtsH [Anaerolineae bacterium]
MSVRIPRPPKKYQFFTLQHSLALFSIILAIATMLSWSYAPQTIPLPELAHIIKAGQVKSLAVRGDLLVATKTDGVQVNAFKEHTVSTIASLQFFEAPPKILKALPIVVETADAPQFSSWHFLLFLTLAAAAGSWLSGHPDWIQERSSSFPFFNTRRSKPHFISGSAVGKHDKAKLSPVTFQDVAGANQAKLELQEIIEFLKEPAKFSKLGARIPKGVLMAGPPGTGKTLLAKAVAGEAGVPFFSISGSEFVEMFVGVGAARVRDLFKQARKHAPSVVFVDEIDAVGRQRGSSGGYGNDEREQTLNQILVEMDGFTTDTNVIVMASTNRPDILDPALMRPGRFDRKVMLDRPDVVGREAILEVHLRGKPLDPALAVADLARLTPGFVGADLENLVNEAAILAARRNLTVIGRAEFQDAMERIIAGPERQGKILSEQERLTVAYHEAGHAVAMHYLEHCDPVHKVSIVSRGLALGYTMPLPEGDKYLRSRAAFEDEIVGLLAGRAAEELIFNQITTGASNDLERATKAARAMVTRYGFSPKLGLRSFGEEGRSYLSAVGEGRDYSEAKARAIDEEIDQILQTAYNRAKTLLTEHRAQLESLTAALLQQETIERTAFEALMA